LREGWGIANLAMPSAYYCGQLLLSPDLVGKTGHVPYHYFTFPVTALIGTLGQISAVRHCLCWLLLPPTKIRGLSSAAVGSPNVKAPIADFA